MLQSPQGGSGGCWFPSYTSTAGLGTYLHICISFKRRSYKSLQAMATQTNKERFSCGLAKALEEQWQVDVRLKAEDSDEDSAIYAHKLILGSRSEVFKKILESDEIKTSTNEVETVTLSEMKRDELEALVEFMYSDGSLLSVKVKQHVRSLYIAGDKYEIMHLRDLCRYELISSLNSSNALDFLGLAQIPFDKVLNDAAFNYIKTNITTIASSDEFKLFVTHNPNLAVEIMKASLSQTSNEYCSNCGYSQDHTNNTDSRQRIRKNVWG